jgi:hypothetical protein
MKQMRILKVGVVLFALTMPADVFAQGAGAKGPCYTGGLIPRLAGKTRVFVLPVLEAEVSASGGRSQTVTFAKSTALVARDGTGTGEPTIVVADKPVRVSAKVQICVYPDGVTLPARFAGMQPQIVIP